MSTVNAAALERKVRDYAEAQTVKAAEAFVTLCRSNMPRRTGAMAESVQVDSIYESRSGYTARIVVDSPYARFQNEGTGIYGPDGAPITPKSGNVLVFDGIGGMVFARSVRGTEPTHFWERTIERWPDILGAL